MACEDRAFSTASSVPEDEARRDGTVGDVGLTGDQPGRGGGSGSGPRETRAPKATKERRPGRGPEAVRGTSPGGATGPFGWLFRREVVILAWIALAVGIVMPPRGIGFSTCTLYMTTHLPCPGCGITRSVASLFHGHWVWSLRYHPLGWLIALWIVGVTGSVFWPRRWREATRQFASRHENLSWRVFWVLMSLWLLYGIVRLVLVAKGIWQFPPASLA